MDFKKHFKSILGKTNNPETEQEFRETCLHYESQCSAFNQPLSHDYQQYLDYYHQISSLYLIKTENDLTKLVIYDTESEKLEEKILDIPETLGVGTSITQLPNGDLFCFGKDYPLSGRALIINKSFEYKILPSGTPCSFPSIIYFNNNVYCFGGIDDIECEALKKTSKFDLNEYRWINYPPMPFEDHYGGCVIFNGNILICTSINANIFLYSIDIDSFSIIPYEFIYNKTKTLMNVGRLYLFEWCVNGLVYESEDMYNWKIISKTIIRKVHCFRFYCSYNKGGIFIGAVTNNKEQLIDCYKFDLRQKIWSMPINQSQFVLRDNL